MNLNEKSESNDEPCDACPKVSTRRPLLVDSIAAPGFQTLAVLKFHCSAARPLRKIRPEIM
jgi:hypothetical protein